ncbi:MAG: hypothetical protein WAU68_10660 [Vitreimonas sp.]
MLWVDCRSYVGPDRRVAPRELRIRERRHDNIADQPPPLERQLRHLRLLVLDADRGDGVRAFAQRASAAAHLAGASGEPMIADILTGLAESLRRGHDGDVRSFIYEQLDRLPGAQVLH